MWSIEVSKVLCEFDYEKIPENVLKNAKIRILDTLGIALAASKMKFAKIMFEFTRRLGTNSESTIIGSEGKSPLTSAILANGAFAHGLDFDDTHPPTAGHISASTIPTALSVGELLRVSGRKVLESSIIGAELMLRVLSVTSTLNFLDRGFHISCLTAPFGSAFTAGKLMGLSENEIANAIGLCGSQASGIVEPFWDGSWTKAFHLGWAQHAGVIAVMLAQGGYKGTRKVFEGENGFYKVFAGKNIPLDFSKLIDRIGEEWETLKLCIKPYPC